MLCCQVEHAQHLSKTYAKVRFPSNKIKITLLQKLLAEMKWIFCTKITYLKILKAKDQLQ